VLGFGAGDSRRGSGGGLKAIHIAAGGAHGVAATEHGSVRTWGCNNYGQLGRCDTLSFSLSFSRTHIHTYTHTYAYTCMHTRTRTDHGSVMMWWCYHCGQNGRCMCVDVCVCV